MHNNTLKPEQEVYFGRYCRTCKHEKKKDTEEPCFECLSNPTNHQSHKPVKWVDKKENV